MWHRKEFTTSTVTQRPAQIRRRPSAAGYWLATTLALTGLLAAAVWWLTSYLGTTRHIDGFTRVPSTGPAVVTIDQPGSYFVYYEAPRAMMMGPGASFQVTGPSGRPLDVQPGYGMRYAVPGRPGCVGTMVGRFRAGVPGRYRMWVNQSDPAATIAVGNDINLRVLPSLVGAGAVLILTAAGALGLVITTWYRFSRPADDR